jgi:KUP system potassium uptake protein
MSAAADTQARGSAKLKLALGALGVVFGDIGTSPLYALRDTFGGHHPLPLDRLHVFGIVSLMFWSMMLIVTIKYVTIIMRADNRGEGGSLALLALINQHVPGRKWSAGIVLLGVFATSLFYGDSMITPAVSVLGAIEGVAVYNPALEDLIVPLVVAILVGLFLLQARGTARVAALFGPMMLIYFATIAVLGGVSIAAMPQVVEALSPHHAVAMFIADPWRGFLAMGAAVLAVTGAEALYADMGHFGRGPIRISWLSLVYPALTLNYLGQAALLLRDPAAVESPFYLLAPQWFQWPLLLIASGAAIIASQAVISGAFSVTQQAIQLGFMPRMSIKHTSETAAGQIYIPVLNWGLMIAVIVLVLMFQRSENLTAAYGIAVTGAMLIDNFLLAVVLFGMWKWKPWLAVPLLAVFFALDGAYLAANLTKIPEGGWVPLLMGVAIFTLLTTWSRGRALMRQNMVEGYIPMEVFTKSAHTSAARVPGTAVFMASSGKGVPSALLHNIKHNKVLHERVVILTVSIEDVPYVEGERAELKDLGQGFYRLVLHYGFLEETDVPAALKQVKMDGGPFDMMQTSFFLSRQTLIAAKKPGMAIWREKLFAWMLRNAASAMEFFRLPTNRVVELGSQVEI